MAYTKQQEIADGKVLKAKHLHNMEDGIIANENSIKEKQSLLQSGVNIKTINGQSLLGAGNLDFTGSSEGGIASSYLVESKELFGIYKDKDIYLSSGTLSDGTATIFPKGSNSKNARTVVVNMEAGATYSLSISNSNDVSTCRMKIVAFEEAFDEIVFLDMYASSTGVDTSVTPVTLPKEIVYDSENKTEKARNLSLTYTNEQAYKTMLILCGWGTETDPTGSITIQNPLMNGNTALLKENIKITEENLDGVKLSYEPWGGYLDPDVYEAQDIINLTNALRANIANSNNLASKHILEIAYNFWKRRNEFIYCSYTALDTPWDYWSYVGFVDSANTGKTVGAGNGGYKRIDCSTFVTYVVNGIDYYSTPYYNALEWTEVTQGALTSGVETDSDDVTVCRTGKMYLRLGKKHIVESADSSTYSFTGIYAYNSSDEIVQDLTGKTSFTLSGNVSYIRAEMKVSDASNYVPAVKGESPAAILRCLRIREDERLTVNAGVSGRNAFQMCQWFDNNGYGLVAYDDYNPLFWEDNDFKPGTVVFTGRNTSSNYKHITHITVYVGGGYIIHAYAPRGLLGGEGIMMDQLRDMQYRYDYPFTAAASPKYHTDYSEEKSLLGIS